MKKDYVKECKESKIVEELQKIGEKSLQEASHYQSALDDQAAKYNLAAGITTEVVTMGAMAGVNYLATAVAGTVIFSNPIIATVGLGVGIYNAFKPELVAELQRFSFYRKYTTVSSHFDHAKKVIDNKNAKKK